ncbi:glycoside hydrolase [Methylacidiphilum caldifontis]|uniref:Glycoside hydrolase n=2 Tax=Methylacidiphilum caldifontis TaxID=2795386 RepID=A0A4Y8PGU1_9BACT|nr:glycoside hydrolase [Methylacidiphilum caldifontis]
MARNVVIYLVMHQPRRLRLPALSLTEATSAREMAERLFDDDMNAYYVQKVARTSYRPTLTRLRDLVQNQGLRLGIGISWSLIWQLERWAPDVLDLLAMLVDEAGVELVGVEPYHSFLPYLDIKRFQRRMTWMSQHIQRRFGQPVQVTDTTEMMMNQEIYWALDKLGFRAAFVDGRPQVLKGRPASGVFWGGGSLRLLVRHVPLSDDVGYRFTDRHWDAYPLMASIYAGWIKNTPDRLVVLGWDFETFGEHHRVESGIFEFLDHLPRELAQAGVATHTPSEALDLFEPTERIDLPVESSTWAGVGDVSFFLGNPVQQHIFRLMHHAYHLAVVSGETELIDLALWLLQSDHLHLIQWYGRTGPEAEVSAYFTPKEWWPLGADGIVAQMAQVYHHYVAKVADRLQERVSLGSVVGDR